jgi:hypothetical protein
MIHFQGVLVDGHALKLSLSDRSKVRRDTGHGGEEEEVKARGTKLLVRNVPFEATRKELFDLFGYVHLFFSECFNESYIFILGFFPLLPVMQIEIVRFSKAADTFMHLNTKLNLAHFTTPKLNTKC